MQRQKPPNDPTLSDIFKTAIKAATPTERETPSITINGSGNVFAWGGTVFVNDAAAQRRAARQRSQ